MPVQTDVLPLLARGLSAAEIAKRLGCLPEYVRAVAYRNGLQINKTHPRQAPDDWAAMILAGIGKERRAALRRGLKKWSE